MPRMPKSSTWTPAGSSLRARRPATSTPKPSSPKNTLPMPATRIRGAVGPAATGSPGSGSTSSGEKKKRWPIWRCSPRSRPGRAARAPPSTRAAPESPPRKSELADGPVEPHQLRLRERLGPVEDLARPRIRLAHLPLLLVGEREDVQDQQLVDLAAVEEVARALGRDLRVVGENDRRAEHGAPVARLADEHRPDADVAAVLGRFPQLVGRVRERDELAAPGAQHGVGRAEGLPEGLLAVRAVPPGRVADAHPHPVKAVRELRGIDLDRPPQRPPAPLDRPYLELLYAGASRDVELERPGGAPELSEPELARRDLPLTRLVPAQVTLAPGLELLHRLEATGAGAQHLPRDHVQEANDHLELGSFVTPHQALRLHRRRVVGMGGAVALGVDAAERPPALVLHGRLAVGPQDVALVQHGVGDPPDRVHA